MNHFIPNLHAFLRNSRRKNGHMGDSAISCHIYKEYPRMERVFLPEPEPLSVTLTDSLRARSSANEFFEGKLSIKTVSNLLGHALRERSDKHRPYPSGGGLYAIEAYIQTYSGIEGIANKIMHYHPAQHALEILWDTSQSPSMSPQLSVENAPTHIILTATWEQKARKYHDFSFLLTLLEAGHIGQNILLLASALGLQARPFSGFDDTEVNVALDLDTTAESAVYIIGVSTA